MTQRRSDTAQQTWLGDPAGTNEAFNEGKLWFGRHDADQDVLVFDPAETDPRGDRLSLYSLTQCRKRTFPRSVVEERVHVLTDRAELERAKRQYRDRAERRAAHERATAAEAEKRQEQRRVTAVEAHRRRLGELGLEYAGVGPIPTTRRATRRTKCYACGGEVDDFTRAVCLRCEEVLCYCGACACGAPARGRRAASQPDAAGVAGAPAE